MHGVGPKRKRQRFCGSPVQVPADLLDEVRQHLLEIPKGVPEQIEREVGDLFNVVEAPAKSGNDSSSAESVWRHCSICSTSLRSVHDRHGALGHVDDIDVIRELHRELSIGVSSSQGVGNVASSS